MASVNMALEPDSAAAVNLANATSALPIRAAMTTLVDPSVRLFSFTGAAPTRSGPCRSVFLDEDEIQGSRFHTPADRVTRLRTFSGARLQAQRFGELIIQQELGHVR